MTIQKKPTKQRTCKICKGPIYHRTNVALRMDQEDTSQPLLHVNPDDWEDNPHDAEEDTAA